MIFRRSDQNGESSDHSEKLTTSPYIPGKHLHESSGLESLAVVFYSSTTMRLGGIPRIIYLKPLTKTRLWKRID